MVWASDFLGLRDREDHSKNFQRKKNYKKVAPAKVMTLRNFHIVRVKSYIAIFIYESLPFYMIIGGGGHRLNQS